MASPRFLHEALDLQAASTPSALASVCHRVGGSASEAATFAELRELSLGLAAALRSRLPRAVSGGGLLAPLPVVAVRLSRTHSAFLPVVLALSRLGAPFVLLSTDLPDKALEATREELAGRVLRPDICIASADVAKEIHASLGEVVLVEALKGSMYEASDALGSPRLDSGPLLCVMFTGGTSRTKVVQVTHDMFMHERSVYKEVWHPAPGKQAVVLAHTSLYWGASALGQLSIAIAYGGATVWCEATEIPDLLRCITKEGVTVLGVVPDHLDLLAPANPERELPGVECVFTWGERLPRRVAERWRAHPRAVLRELLIATEYWLTLYADPLAFSGSLCPVSGAEILILGEDGQPVPDGSVGEMYLAGRMVTRGYLDDGTTESDNVFVTMGGKNYFRTRDLVRRLPDGGVVYRGRADMMAKSKGKWVDMSALEDKLQQLDGVRSAKIVQDPKQEHFHAFVCLLCSGTESNGADGVPTLRPTDVLLSIRELLPHSTRTWVLPTLPRHIVTRKVDVARLLRSLPRPWPNWPFEPALSSSPSGASSSSAGSATAAAAAAAAAEIDGRLGPLKRRLGKKVITQLTWHMVAVNGVIAVSDAEDLVAHLALTASWAVALSVANGRTLGRSDEDEDVRSRRALYFTTLWLAASVAVRPTPAKLGRFLFAGATLSYMYLALTYADDARFRKWSVQGWRLRACEVVMSLSDAVPLLKLGLFLVLSALDSPRVPQALAVACRSLRLALAAAGVTLAWRRGRVLAWPLIVWCGGLGNQLEVECGAWSRLETWQWELSRRAAFLQSIFDSALVRLRLAPPPGSDEGQPPSLAFAPPAAGSGGPGGGAASGDAASGFVPAPPPTFQCSNCSKEVVGVKWPSSLPSGKACDACGAEYVTAEEARASAWLRDQFRPSEAASSPAKRRRVEEDEEMPAAQGLNGATARESVLVHDRGGPSFDRLSVECPPIADFTSMEQWQRAVDGFEKWWWYNQTEEYYDADAISVQRFEDAFGKRSTASGGRDSSLALGAAPAAPPETADLSKQARLLCALVLEQAPTLGHVAMSTTLSGMDSLRLTRLAYAIKLRFGRTLGTNAIRAAGTVSKLLTMIEEAEVDPVMNCTHDPKEEEGREFAVWFSPGQFGPMGCWVLRTDKPLDVALLRRVVSKLCDRHVALRSVVIDPMHYMSIVFDAAVTWNLYWPAIEAAGFKGLRFLQQLLGWAIHRCWPRVRCMAREEVYGPRFPSSPAAPVVEVSTDDKGRPLLDQTNFEHELKRQSRGLFPPLQVSVMELKCYLVDFWVHRSGWHRFAIIRTAFTKSTVGLAYVDVNSQEWGPLVGPDSDEWRTPPYRFPAIFFIPLNSGNVIWVRMDKADEVHLCYKTGVSRTAKQHHVVAYRGAPQRPREASGEPAVSRFVAISMFHNFGDGNTFTPIAQDLFALWDNELEALEKQRQQVAAGNTGAVVVPAELPRLPGVPALEVLQRRLCDTIYRRPSPDRSSLRGGLWFYRGGGYGYTFGLEPNAVSLLERASASLGLPFDVALLGLVICSQARADASELVEFTMYAPMRDGAAETAMVGLFSDWRDVSVGVDFELATLLGTLLQLFQTVQLRQWTPFNALRKPERTVVNMQPLDTQRRGQFRHIGENLWHGGDRFRDGTAKRDSMPNRSRQPLVFNLEQQDETTWWILVDVGLTERPPAWMRRFSRSFREALDDFIVAPLSLIHKPLPEYL